MIDRLRLSRRLAYVFGVLTPIAETVRRWGAWWEYPPAYLDDVLLGALLVGGAWAARRPGSSRGRALLAAAWGFACGMAYYSLAAHWLAMRSGQVDPAPIPTGWVFAIKLFGSLVFVAGLVLAVSHRDDASSS